MSVCLVSKISIMFSADDKMRVTLGTKGTASDYINASHIDVSFLCM